MRGIASRSCPTSWPTRWTSREVLDASSFQCTRTLDGAKRMLETLDGEIGSKTKGKPAWSITSKDANVIVKKAKEPFSAHELHRSDEEPGTLKHEHYAHLFY